MSRGVSTVLQWMMTIDTIFACIYFISIFLWKYIVKTLLCLKPDQTPVSVERQRIIIIIDI